MATVVNAQELEDKYDMVFLVRGFPPALRALRALPCFLIKRVFENLQHG